MLIFYISFYHFSFCGKFFYIQNISSNLRSTYFFSIWASLSLRISICFSYLETISMYFFSSSLWAGSLSLIESCSYSISFAILSLSLVSLVRAFELFCILAILISSFIRFSWLLRIITRFWYLKKFLLFLPDIQLF